MKITIENSYLRPALSDALRAISSVNTLPILSNVLIEAQEDRVKITATDLDTSIERTIPATIRERGAVAVSGRLFQDIVSKLDGPISLQLEDAKLKVRAGRSEYTLLLQSAEDFPAIPTVASYAEAFTIPAPTLLASLRRTLFAASKEQTRSILMGVLIETKGVELAFVATDTHRLARVANFGATSQQADTKPRGEIIPASALSTVATLLSDAAKTNAKSDASKIEGSVPVSIRIDGSRAEFIFADTRLVSRVLDGAFPHYEKVIPSSFEHCVAFERAELLSALARINIVAKQEKEKAVWLFGDGIVQIKAETEGIGRANEEVALVDIKGLQMPRKGFECAINSRYIMDTLNVMTTKNVRMEFNSPLNPFLFTEVDADPSAHFLYVAMPMQV